MRGAPSDVKTPISDFLDPVLDGVRDIHDGEVVEGLPERVTSDPEWLSAAVCTVSGNIYSAGDHDLEFTMQSISKSFVYALALRELGRDKVFETVGMEPSGEAFNELSLGRQNRPMNPLINAGAIAVNQLINGEHSSVTDRVERIREFLSDLAGRELKINEAVADSEFDNADNNLAIAHMLRGHGIISDDAREAVLSYTRQCSVEVTVRDLAVMSATLANGGTQPVTGEKILSRDVCRLTLSVMSSAGMYDASGRWMATVGIPAKSGITGGLIGTLPGQLGLATMSPRLDQQGNSVRGVKIFERFSEEMGLHLMEPDPWGTNAVRSIETHGEDVIISLQGTVNFASAEKILDDLSHRDFTGHRLILDVSHTAGFHRMSRKMVKEGLRRFREDGFAVAIYDPGGMIGDFEFSDGTHAGTIDHR